MAAHEVHIQAEVNPGPLDNPPLEFLRSYWLRKRGDRAMPARKDMVPSELKKYLDSLVMIDVLPDMADFRYRLIGTAVTQYFLVDPTGKSVAETWAPMGSSAVDRIIANLRAVARERACTHLWGAVDWFGRGAETVDALYLPLSDDGETVNMIVNMFIFDRRNVLRERQIAIERGQRLFVS